jgi:hypothetical protein
MRFLLTLLLMVGLMAAAGLWQERWTQAARQQRDVLLGRAAPPPSAAVARLVLGRPSGRAPFDVPVGPPAVAPRQPGSGPAYSAPLEPSPAQPEEGRYAAQPWEPVFELEVRPGKVLSVLCQEFYGTSRPAVVQRVAEWNRLASPDQLKVGQRLELPARAWVLGELP